MDVTERQSQFLTTFQASKLTGVSLRTIINWADRRGLVTHRTPGGHRRIAPEDLRRFLQRHGMPVPAEVTAVDASLAASDLDDGDERLRVLVVDDNPDFLAAVRSYLVRLRCQVEIAESGFEAGVQVGSFRPHLVLLDILMPSLDGFEVVRYLKARYGRHAHHVVAVTAAPDEDFPKRAEEAGFDAFIHKDALFNQLGSLVARMQAEVARAATRAA